LQLIPAGFLAKPGLTVNAWPGPPYIRLQTALRLRPRRALSSAEAEAAWIKEITYLKEKNMLGLKVRF
jgi:hypothetical protein